MKFKAVIKQLDRDVGTVCVDDQSDNIIIPLKYLPKDCRVGDTIHISIWFDPFETLSKA